MENEKLKLHIFVQEDITKFHADIIVNSVGVGAGVKEYGGICGAILKAVKTKKLKETIDKAKDVYVIGEFFFTKGYELTANNIVHLITPYFVEDQDFVIYKDCIRRILRECVKKGFKTIGVPLIGTGANGYDENAAFEVLAEIITAFNKAYEGEAIATIVIAPNDISFKNKLRIDREMPSNGRRTNIEKDIIKGSNKYLKEYKPKQVQEYDKSYFEYDEDNEERKSILPSSFKHEPENPMEYADEYVWRRYMYQGQLEKAAKERVRAFVGYGADNPKTAGSKSLSQYTINTELERYFVIIFGLKMNMEEAEAFLHYFSKSFPAPKIYPAVTIIKELINNKIHDLYEIKAKINIFSK